MQSLRCLEQAAPVLRCWQLNISMPEVPTAARASTA